MKIIYIHGASSTAKSFNYLKSQLPEHEAAFYEYDNSEVPYLLPTLIDHVRTLGDVSIVGHSLGGVIAVYLANECSNVSRVVTLAAPFGGCKSASFTRFMTLNSSILDQIHPYSKLMMKVAKVRINTPTLSIVTTSGQTCLLTEPNDGVITINSQTTLSGPKYIPLSLNHFEVLLSDEVVNLTREFLWE